MGKNKMTLTPEEVQELKTQLYSQIENLPEDKKALAKKQIEEMSAETLEYLLKQQQSGKKSDKSIFRMIVDGEADSIQVGENKKALAVLDINPISAAHAIIIPKSPVKDAKALPNAAFSLAKALSKRIIKNSKASKTEIHTENKFGETIIHVLPSYNEPVHLGSQRQKASKEELEKIAQKIRLKKRIRLQKIKKKQVSEIVPIKRRIP